MKRPAAESEVEASDDADEDGGRSLLFWLAIAFVVAIPVMIFLTVTLSAVIGAFVLGLGEEAPATPQAAWDGQFEEDASELHLRHQAGDPIDVDTLTVLHEGSETNDWTARDDAITSGDRITVSDVERGDEVALVWERPGTDESAVIAQFTAF